MKKQFKLTCLHKSLKKTSDSEDKSKVGFGQSRQNYELQTTNYNCEETLRWRSTHLHNTLKTYDCQDKSEMNFGQNDEPEVMNYNCEEAPR